MKNWGIFKLLIIISVFLISSLDSFSQLVINTFDKIDCSKYPICSVNMMAERNGIKVNITHDNLVIVENNNSSRPIQVVDNPDGSQKVHWYCTLGALYDGAVFYLSDDSETAVNAEYYDSLINYMSQVRIFPSTGEIQKDFFFNTPDIGGTFDVRVDLKVIMAPQRIVDGISISSTVRIDSIKTYTEDFKAIWYGGSESSSWTLPFEAVDGFTYGIFIKFSGSENKLYRDKLTVFYEGGLTEEVNLIANSYKIPSKTILTLLEPKLGEHLTPCQKDTIKWKGNVPGIMTKADYSLNGGATWIPITQSKDSMIVWTIPDIITNNFLVRVRQDPQTLPDKILGFDDIPFEQCRFSENALFILGSNVAGKIYEWDLTQTPPTRSEPYIIGAYYELPPIDNLQNLFVGYTDDHKTFVTAFRYLNIPYRNRQDTLAFFNVGNYEPFLKVGLKLGVRISKMLIDYQKRWISILPESSNLIKLYSPINGEFIKDLVFDTPIIDYSFVSGTDSLVLAFQDNSIRIYDLNTNQITSSFDFKSLKLISKVALSPNGKYISFSTIMPNPTLNEYSFADPISGTYIYEISSGMLVRTYREHSSNALGMDFNPTSNKTIRASITQPQVMFTDLSSPTIVEKFSLSESVLDNYCFATEGHSLAAISQANNLFKVLTFSYSEIDEIDEPISIEYPLITVQNIKIDDKYIGTSNPYTFTTNFCNNGNVPFLMKDAHLIRNKNFKLLNLSLPDTVWPGDCYTFNIEYNPIDTGAIVDSLEFSTCAQNLYVKLESRGLPRNISFYSPNIEFGEVCLGSSISNNILLLKNEDPVPLRLNNIEFFDKSDKPFLTTYPFRDTVIEAGGSYSVEITFSPTILKENTKTLRVFHSNQKVVVADTKVSGIGIGTDLSFSHTDLRFIPEIRSRKFTVYNNQSNDVELSTYNFTPDGLYALKQTLPLVINANDSVQLDVEFIGELPGNSELEFITSPCYNSYRIYLGPYTGTSFLTINNTQADPRGAATISVRFNNEQAKEYNGERFFEAELTINPRMFIPYGDNSVKSNYGTASLIKNEVVNDKRVIGFRVDGIFPNTGIVVDINGLAGLAETSTSPIEFVGSSIFWSRAVNNVLTNGTFTLINVCGERYVNQSANSISIYGLSPNPVNDKFILNLYSKVKTDCTIEIYDNNGNLLLTTSSISIVVGTNEIPVNAGDLISGNYKIVVKTTNDIAVGTFVVIK